METGAITSHIDVAQVILYLFWGFFAALILYLRREDKREGYPLESDRSGRVTVQGFPSIPRPKIFRLSDGSTRQAPRVETPGGSLSAEPVGLWPGAPLEPTGNAMLDGVGPAAFSDRPEQPDRTYDGRDRVVPLSIANDHALDPRDPNPLGMRVIGADGEVAGTVVDAWVDRTEPHLRYLEIELSIDQSARRVLLPIGFTRIRVRPPQVEVASILAAQFVDVPGLASEERITMREEDRICAYYGGGRLYAEPSRQEPYV